MVYHEVSNTTITLRESKVEEAKHKQHSNPNQTKSKWKNGTKNLSQVVKPLEPKKCNLVADKKRDAKDCNFSL